MKSAQLLFRLCCAAFFLSGATDGSTGATSTGTTNITLTLPQLLQISGLADRAFGTWNGTTDMTMNDDVCVYTNLTAGTYRVTGTGSGSGGAFAVQNGAANLAYQVRWNDQAGTTGNMAMTAGVALTGQTGAHTTSQTCAGGMRGNFQVTFVTSALGLAPSGSYSGVLSFVVEPN